MPGPARHEHRVEAADVDAELEGVGRRDPAQVAGREALLERAALLGQVARAVGRDCAGELGVDLLERVPGEERDDLGAAPRADEGQGAHALIDQVGQQVGRLGRGGAAHRGALLAVQVGERRLPQREDRSRPVARRRR